MELTKLNLTLPLTPPCSIPIHTGIPFPRGELFTSTTLYMMTAQQDILDTHAVVTSRWPDGSIQWATIYTLIPSAFPAGQHQLTLMAGVTPVLTTANVLPTDTGVSIETDKLRISHSTERLGSFDLQVEQDSPPLKHSVLYLTENDKQLYGAIEHSNITEHNGIFTRYENTGSFITCNPGDPTEQADTQHSIKFQSSWTLYNNAPFIAFSITVRNPNAATHPNGLWDLGDPASTWINAFQLNVEGANFCVSLSPEIDSSWNETTQPFTLTQYSSGGPNWNSPNHKNAEASIPFSIRGYTVSQDPAESIKGQRASPIIYANMLGSETGVGIYLENFWQNFPTAISTSKTNICLDLFPNISGPIELQAGEQKTYTGYFYVGNAKTALEHYRQPATLSVAANWFANCNVLPWFQPKQSKNSTQSLIQAAITGSDSFFHKREIVDEYGWRNFGDLYADHETLGYTGTDIFVSHYNNQYDPIYGFLRQFALSGDHRWFELANDLAHHVIDIDIYHTEEDRSEYNLGPFWHTDHYLDAGTSTHRTYSKDHLLTEPNTGGGPGGQHCYTTGLMYHYWFTGEAASKQTVLDLTQWITDYYEGTGGLMDVALNFKNRSDPGLKKQFSNKHAYPLDRGIGNYINALLDSHALTSNYQYIQKAEQIIRQTVHPNDPIALRDLENVEDTWFYTVFFQALIRYLQRKELIDEKDEPFQYARATLLHYANWLVAHEQPYLDKPDILEYPNHTWTAQDIRKANMAYCASQYAQTQQESEKLLAWAEKHNNYVVQTLSTTEEKTFTRILAILMQNAGPHDFYQSRPELHNYGAINYEAFGHSPLEKPSNTVIAITKPVLKALCKFSLKHELDWLKRRTGTTQHYSETRGN